MAGTLRHAFVSAKADGADASKARASNWNADHTFAGGSHLQVLQRDTGASDGASWTGAPTISGANITALQAANLSGTIASAVQDAITRVGALTSGSIGGSFGAINIGSNSLTAGAASFTSGAFSSAVTVTDAGALPNASDYTSLLLNGSFTGTGGTGGLISIGIAPTFSGATAVGSFCGPYTTLYLTGAGGVTRLMGTVARMNLGGSGHITQAYGFYGSVLEGAGTHQIDYIANFWSRPASLTGAMPIYAGYGMRVDALTPGSATIQQLFGVAIQQPSGAAVNNIGVFIGAADSTPFGGASSVAATAALYVQSGQSYFGGNVGIGYLTSGGVPWNTSTRYGLTITGITGSGALEFRTQAADGNGVSVGDIYFRAPTNTGGTAEKRVVLFSAITAGSTANDRGGQFSIYTKADGSGTLNEFDFLNDGSLRVPNSVRTARVYTDSGDLTLAPAANLIFNVIPKFAGTNTTGSGSAALGSNCPATTTTAPYTWIRVLTSDGSTAYIPAWK